MKRIEADPCVYVRGSGENIVILAVYVDDMLILTSNDNERRRLKSYLSKKFEMKDLGEARKFLGLEITQDKHKGEIKVSQASYINKILEKFGMNNCKPVGTPTDLNVKLDGDNTDDAGHGEEYERFKGRYLEAVGSLSYVAQATRPDIAQAVNAVSKQCIRPKNIHWTAVKRIFRCRNGVAER